MGDIDSYSNSGLDITRDSKLGCSAESLLEGRCESYASKLALRASLRYTGEDDQWQTKRRSLRDRNKYLYHRELFSDVRFLVGRGEKTSIPAHASVRVGNKQSRVFIPVLCIWSSSGGNSHKRAGKFVLA